MQIGCTLLNALKNKKGCPQLLGITGPSWFTQCINYAFFHFLELDIRHCYFMYYKINRRYITFAAFANDIEHTEEL